jgi:hypothetical protein
MANKRKNQGDGMNITDLKEKKIDELTNMAKDLNVEAASGADFWRRSA